MVPQPHLQLWHHQPSVTEYRICFSRSWDKAVNVTPALRSLCGLCFLTSTCQSLDPNLCCGVSREADLYSVLAESKNHMTSYRIEPLLLVQKLSKVLGGCTQHALLLKVLNSSLWFLVKPIEDPEKDNLMKLMPQLSGG